MISSLISFTIKQRFAFPSMWDCAWGLLVFVLSLTYHFAGLLTITEFMPVDALVYGFLTTLALSVCRAHTYQSTASLKLLTAGIAILFSQFVTIGGSFFLRHDWSLCFSNKLTLIIWALQSFCYSYVFFTIVLGFFNFIQNTASDLSYYKYHAQRWFCLLVVVRLIYFFLLYPCVFDIDAAIGLRTFLDPDSAICNHHPLLVQSFHGLFFIIGKYLGYRSIGIALLSLIFICISSGILTYGLSVLAKSKIGRIKIISIALIYTFFPFFPFLSVFVTKDGFFAYTFLFYVFTLYQLYQTKGDCLRKTPFIVFHILSILFLCLTRHQGFYLVLAEIIVLLYCFRTHWHRIFVIYFLSLAFVFLYSNLLLPFLNVEPAGKQEIYGTLFHQSANYLRQYPDQTTESERLAIFNILDRNKIIHDYEYNLTDGSKDSYKYNPLVGSHDEQFSFRHVDHSYEQIELKAYLSSWLSMFIKHPLCYLQATTGVFIGFFYNNNEPLVKVESYWNTMPAITTDYIFGYYDKYEWTYNVLARVLVKIPVINWLFAIPYYLWLTIVALALLIYRKEMQSIAVFLPVILSVVFLLICPHASGRYSFPIVASLPLLIIHLMSSNNTQQCQE